MYKHEVRIGRSTPNSSRSTSGPALTPGSAIGAAAFFAFCFYLIYKIIDLVIRPILVLLYRLLSSGVRYLYRNRRPIAQAIKRTAATTYNYCRKCVLKWRKLPSTAPPQLSASTMPEALSGSTVTSGDRVL
jgi:hypothetical protein